MGIDDALCKKQLVLSSLVILIRNYESCFKNGNFLVNWKTGQNILSY